MNELHSSRREVMRALIIAPSLIATPVASAATGLVCTPTTTQDPAWLALLEDERRTAAAAKQAGKAADDAFGRFSNARASFMEGWQAEWDDKHGKPYKFIDARPAHEEGDCRINAGMVDYNAFPKLMKAKRDQTTAALNSQYRVAETEEVWSVAHDTHIAAIKAIIAYPSRDPDIIAHKLRLLIDQFGDDEGDFAPLLTSITGEA
ncbi:hypothetical protein HHL26_06900 [Sphingobium sp. TB-6]|uniref:hypothetical protein n=1 Tax=Sphingobium sp. TB-6 TaxID=2728850 RepID=UPI00146D613E|nr:hypothetical protein [Sphingobium sp. TB-6]NML88795.1 hypothetical protein [Sphingobium sp. TB-6]